MMREPSVISAECTLACVRLEEANALGEREFMQRFGGVFEHSPWVAERAWRKRPFASIDVLHNAMMQAVAEATRDEQLTLIRAHPELAGADPLTVASSSEQARLGFDRLSEEEALRMSRLNRTYREKHGFACIVALRLHDTRASVMAEMERRIGNDSDAEIRNALEQIGHITRGRLEKVLR
jgi:OHCU decarboxylase